MKLSLSTFQNEDAIMGIIADAQIYLAELKIDQWQDGYPNAQAIRADITQRESYVVQNEDGVVMATSMFTTAPESTYEAIEGEWIVPVTEIYGVVHRMAISNAYRSKGIAQFMFAQFENKLVQNQVKSLKVDTHQQNLGMQALLKKLGYQYCGIITLNSGDLRLGFEKVLLD